MKRSTMKLTDDRAASSVDSPPPCGEGLGVGVPFGARESCHNEYPPPQPSPTRGEGAGPSRCAAVRLQWSTV